MRSFLIDNPVDVDELWVETAHFEQLVLVSVQGLLKQLLSLESFDHLLLSEVVEKLTKLLRGDVAILVLIATPYGGDILFDLLKFSL